MPCGALPTQVAQTTDPFVNFTHSQPGVVVNALYILELKVDEAVAVATLLLDAPVVDALVPSLCRILQWRVCDYDSHVNSFT